MIKEAFKDWRRVFAMEQRSAVHVLGHEYSKTKGRCNTRLKENWFSQQTKEMDQYRCKTVATGKVADKIKRNGGI